MKLARPLRIAAFALAFAGFGSAAWAQAACERYKAELSSLNRAGAAARSYENAAARQQAEIARLAGYYRSIGCERAFFFSAPPAECPAIAQRIQSLQASYGQVVGQAAADPGALEARRRQLTAAIARTCDANRAEDAERTVSAPATGGSRLVCVRSCDGYFFPIENDPEGRSKPQDLCRALCPNAEVSVYRAPADGGIEQAVSETGRPYMQLPNALRYTKAADPNCGCRKPGESWAETLKGAERMIARNRTDIVVNEAIAERMSRASLSAPKVRRPAKETATAVAPADPGLDVETTGSVSTASKETAGIASNASAVPEDRGGAAGGPARPRVIAPDLIPVPLMNGAGPPAQTAPQPIPSAP